ncbi:MAG: DUF1269 domain-containing protein [Gammaproteobacteria bacterium]|nr:DUF1269 domain-containing protein [Gammaproteobacteria bacterium]
MKRRLYFVLPDTITAETVHNELLLSRIPEKQMHAIARDGIDLTDLPQANLFQTSDVVHGAQLGFIIGGFSGVLAGSLAAMMGWLVSGLEVWSVTSLAVGGAFLGAWTSSMVAVNIPNTRLKSFQRAIESGQILFCVDIPASQVDDISDLVRRHHPEADLYDVEPTIPAFP